MSAFTLFFKLRDPLVQMKNFVVSVILPSAPLPPERPLQHYVTNWGRKRS